jgi:hypothetical protein
LRELSCKPGLKRDGVSAEMGGDNSVHLDKALGVPRGLEPSHPPLPLTRRLMRVLGPAIQVPVLSMSNMGMITRFTAA